MLQKSAWLQSPPLAQGIVSPDDLAPFWPGFRERYAGMVAPELLAVGDRFIACGAAWNRPRPTPRSLTHNDFRPDNFLFATPEGGRPVTIVDWQTLTFSYGVLDVAYLIGGAFAGEQRRIAESVLLPAYFDALREAGVRDYAHAQFMDDYRHFTFAGLAIAIIAAMTVGRTERGDRLFLNMFDHHASHVIDQDAIGYLSCP
jgi:aminoglycoside phosphotransferase (APT) family kinase protein